MNPSLKKLPDAVTNLDIIKTVAVIFMIIDHIGFYFFPDNMWYRAVGRLGGVPVWFFLIGYASSRDIPNKWLIGALILSVVDFALINHIFAFNVLVTLILARLCIDPVMRFVLRSRYLFWFSAVLLALFYIPSNWVMEYGSLGLLCATVGYLTRHRDQLYAQTFLTKRDYHGALVFMIVAITMLQTSVFGFDFYQSALVAVGSGLFTIALVTMDGSTYPQITNNLAKGFFQFSGRKTLEIYVAHLVIFKIIYLGMHAL